MTLRARILYPGAVYHVMLRGNGGQDIFFDESDRIRYYSLLEDGGQAIRCSHPCLLDHCTRLGRDLISLSQAVNRVRKTYGNESLSGCRA